MVMRCMLCRITKLIFILPDEAFLRRALSFVKKKLSKELRRLISGMKVFQKIGFSTLRLLGLIRMEFKSIEIDDYYFDILGFKTDQRSESKKFDSKNATKLSQYSLISFQSFVYFYLRVRTNTGSYLVRVFVYNSFMRYHMNECTNRSDEITFPTYSTGGGFAIKNNFYFLSPNVTNKPADKYQFYSDGKAGFLTGEVIRDFTYDTFGRLYHDHSQTEREFYGRNCF